ncbi:MAG: response regulator transcription factor [Elusimicrobia bacterium]|nr:response regulator transcription factor [Elusimicrobiota bacterium]MDE2426867.1 response regulator transcription factor [Elusimicrobiota bacterium]
MRPPERARAGKKGAAALRYKILLVDDDKDNRIVLRQRLENDGFSVIEAAGADEAFLAAVDSAPDLILSDVAMPGGDGLSLCRRLRRDRRTSRLPIIMISGVHNREDDQLSGLEEGADDYLPKSYSPRLLAAKIRGLMSRFAAPEELSETLREAGIALDVHARTVSQNGKRVALTRKEFDLLTIFLRKPGQVLSNNFLLETVWNYDPADYNDPRTIQVHVSSLRRKLSDPLSSRLVSVPGLGYRLEKS